MNYLQKYPVIIVWLVVLSAHIIYWTCLGIFIIHAPKLPHTEPKLNYIEVSEYYQGIHQLGEILMPPPPITVNTQDVLNLSYVQVVWFSIMRVNLFGTGIVLFRMFPMLRNNTRLSLAHMVIFTLLLVDMLVFRNLFNASNWHWSTHLVSNWTTVMYIILYLWSFQMFVFCPGRTMYTRRVFAGLHAFFTVLNWLLCVLHALEMISTKWLHIHYTIKEEDHVDMHVIDDVFSIHYLGVYVYTICILFLIINPYFE